MSWLEKVLEIGGPPRWMPTDDVAWDRWNEPATYLGQHGEYDLWVCTDADPYTGEADTAILHVFQKDGKYEKQAAVWGLYNNLEPPAEPEAFDGTSAAGFCAEIGEAYRRYKALKERGDVPGIHDADAGVNM